jgi:hypothetical protein
MNDIATVKPVSLGEALLGEIVQPTFDLAQDYAELSLEALTDSPIFKEIPVVKTALAVFKTGVAIRERHFVQKVLIFLRELHRGEANQHTVKGFSEQIRSDHAFRDKVASHLLVMIDRYLVAEKAQVLGHLFKAHTNGQISWDDFVSLSMVLDALQPCSYPFLLELATSATPFYYHGGARPEEAFLFAAGIATRHGTMFSVTPLGRKLCAFGIQPSVTP